LIENHKLDPWSLDEGQRPKSGKLKLHDVILEGKSIGSNKKKKKKTELKRRAPDLKNQDASYIVQLKDSICFK
jgi:hypothetical protein